jgi:hypothetical protein
MNDRKLLDEQLGDIVTHFLKEHHITDVQRTDSSLNLSSRLLERKVRVIITTVQKFAKLLKPEFISKRRIAIIADEAHRTHVLSDVVRRENERKYMYDLFLHFWFLFLLLVRVDALLDVFMNFSQETLVNHLKSRTSRLHAHPPPKHWKCLDTK